MATKKRKGKTSTNSDMEGRSTDDDLNSSALEETDLKIKEETFEGTSVSDNSGSDEDSDVDNEDIDTDLKNESLTDPDGSPKSGTTCMSLDVLAQVATDQLEQDPRGPSVPKKLSKRSLLNMDFLHLDQIRTLSPKFLVNLFADMNSNEITRKYFFICHIIPEKCCAVYTSFGSEIKARDLMKNHLLKHVQDLVKLKAANEGFSFIAETVVAKKKREIAERSLRRKKNPNPSVQKSKKSSKGSNKSPKSSGKKYTGLKSPKSKSKRFGLSDMNQDTASGNRSILKLKSSSSATTRKQVRPGDFPMATADENSVYPTLSLVKDEPDDFPKNLGQYDAEMDEEDDDDENNEVNPDDIGELDADGEWDIIEDRPRVPFKRTGRNVARNEKIIWDILCASQPYHDHSYTTVFGRRKAGQVMEDLEMIALEDEVDEEKRPSARTSGLKFSVHPTGEFDASGDEAKSVPVKVGDAPQNKVHIPMVRVEFTPTPDGAALVSSDVMGHSINRPYPPMPKYDLAQQGRLRLPEEQGSSSEDDFTAAIITPRKERQVRRKLKEGTLEWERRLALKCIRELRLKKKEYDTQLVCKICKTKTFTATATLMYHYRSHAGIKPFVCLICNTTFTRQHSLNYHMLIHNNQSRFTCVDCGRKFRHPSHFKEHLRRHTGETPFHCMDCPLRFKTRNTYKRHLKTRHGKLLTANGIKIMPREEFLKLLLLQCVEYLIEFEKEVRSKVNKKDNPNTEDVDDDDIDDDAEDDIDSDGEGTDSDKEAAAGNDSDVNCGSRLASDASDLDKQPDQQTSPCAVVAESVPGSVIHNFADNSASNKLLQLCSQVVKQEGS